MKNTVMIYCAGGAGLSIGAKLSVDTDRGRANTNICYLDTSRSDLIKEVDQDLVFIAGDHSNDKDAAEGSGKVRGRNNSIIAPLIPKVVHTYPPSDSLNIIISSASGGSGAVYASHLLNHLLTQKKPTILIIISSIASTIEIDNSIKTLMSFENAAAKHQTPVVVSHWQNDSLTSEADVDAGIQAFIDHLLILFSGENRKIDKEDLKNLLDYTKVTDRAPKLVYMDIYDQNTVVSDDTDIITTATLAHEGMDTTFPVPIEYQSVGYVSFPDLLAPMKSPTHYCVVDGHAANAVHQLQTALANHKKSIKARQSASSVFIGTPPTDGDIVL